MPLPSQLDCRHGSRESLSFKRCFVTIPSDVPRVRAYNSASAELTQARSLLCSCQAERVALPHCVTPPLVLLQEMGSGNGLSCPVAVCAHVHGLRECTDLDQALCARDTCQVSCDALHVHVIAVRHAQRVRSSTRSLSPTGCGWRRGSTFETCVVSDSCCSITLSQSGYNKQIWCIRKVHQKCSRCDMSLKQWTVHCRNLETETFRCQSTPSSLGM